MKKKILRYLMLVLSLLIAAAIFLFSAENGEKSGNLSDKLAEKILQIFGITDKNSSEENQAETIVSVGSVFRKLAHFIEYFALGGAVCGFFLTYSMTPLRCIWLSSGISVLYAVSDELHQYFVPGRNASVWDVLLDAVGAICGIFAVAGIMVLIRRKQIKSPSHEKP